MRHLFVSIMLLACGGAFAQWRPVSGPLGVFFGSGEKVLIAIDPLDAESAFLGGRLLWHSSDGGKTWARVENVSLRPGEQIWSIAISRDEDGPILASGTARLVSNDRGQTWQRSESPLLLHSFVYAGPAGSKVFWGFDDSRIRRSNDNGLTCETVFEQPGGEQRGRLDCFVADRFDAETISFGVFSGPENRRFLISRDGGATLQELSLPRSDRLLVSLSTDPDDPDLLYACTRREVWTEAQFSFTYDNGETWEPLLDLSVAEEAQTEVWAKLRRVLPETLAFPMPIGSDGGFQLARHQLAWSEDEPGRQVGVADGIVCRSDDYGKTWEPAMAGLAAAAIEGIVLDPRDSKSAFCADSTRLWHTADGGATWRAMPRQIRHVTHVVFSPSGEHVYAACWQTLWRGTRNGTDWEQVWETSDDMDLTAGVFFFETAHGEERESVAVLVTRESLFESRDDGRTWRSAGANAFAESGFPSALRPTQGRVAGQDTWIVVLNSGTGKEYRLASTDHGRTWARDTLGMGPWSVAADGSTWVVGETLVHAPASGTGDTTRREWRLAKPTALVCDPKNADVLYVGCEDGRILRTTDGGNTFSRLEGGPPAIPIAQLVVSPRDGALWVATSGNGVWILDKPKEHPGRPLAE
ncbi:MAG: hypothetical protein JW889_13185 [Verrucomicrobia bacterium]|nr:hypothetical protein [Verrucomicrobiota bacterium]